MAERSNRQVGETLYFMGQLLEVLGENPFKVRAYYKSAEVVERLATPVSRLDEEQLREIPGIGSAIAKKIREIVETGTFHELETVRAGIPEPLIELLSLEGIGPKTVNKLWKKLNVQSIADLEREAKQHRIRAIKGFGEKKEESFLKAIALYRERSGRMTRAEADAVVGMVVPVLEPGTFAMAGSYRRGKSTIGDIDIVSKEPPSVANPKIRTVAEEMIDEGAKKTSFRCLGKRVDVRFSRPEQFGSMLLYLTGSKPFNIRMREYAIFKGFKLNEYGLEDRSSGHLSEFATEEEIFSFLGMDYIVPELREDWGEVEAALARRLPVLVEDREVRGDLHVHSTWSDGVMSLEEIARAGEARGYEYILISDHSATLGIAHGLDEEGLRKQMHEVEVTNRSSSCRLIQGTEVDIMADGTLGLPARVLADVDVVIASIHSAFSQERDVMTRRVLAAVENEHVDIIGHPTGRILGRRQPAEIDIPRVIERAAETGTALECNASPFRLDLDDLYIREATRKKVKIAIGTDAHHPEEFGNIRYGVITCRRGWATAADLLNTMSHKELMEWV
ncbi:DNA polymerase (family 10) [Methanolinea mesophila]|uniref:DNA polymerase/3'-5' exonuclease PolX n=1 Tax=Methanolinea mesophila TaxID=547055 RepID=UPI001FD7894C|nr:DNA polymerase/3'-5' exonuclease PolX [Methanolinea mesophila]MBP1927642.1 DNA polymerase (family 10) [Methanolinea mesophila]